MLSHLQNIQVLGAVFSISLFIVAFFLVKQRLLQDKYSLIWFFVSLFVFIMSVFDEFISLLAELIGVYYPPSLFFIILIVCIYFLLLNMSISLSKLKTQNKILTQELALTKLRMEELAKRVDHD